MLPASPPLSLSFAFGDAHGACVEWRRVASPDGVGVIGSAIDRADRADAQSPTILHSLRL